jgi:hypothetical protein
MVFFIGGVFDVEKEGAQNESQGYKKPFLYLAGKIIT